MIFFYCSIFFFFQAEDGIRDADVTGVQTCALRSHCRIGLFPAGLGNGTPTPFYLNDPGYLSVPQGGVIDLSGSLLGNTHNASQYQVVGTLSVSGGTASTPQLFEAMSNDLGAVPAGFINNFADGTLDFGAGGYTQLVDQ